ncbi:MAG: hypothetical protein IKN77_06605 [Paludibacteraceae bacterium]|nr:hypothetical protein [Paludibacteraceae bacterium]
MDYKEGWNYLVSEYKKNLDAKEDKIQTLWELYFAMPFIFNYSNCDDIDSKRSLHIGSTDRVIPDIILRSNRKDLCIVELKRYSLSKDTDYEKQLLSYMSHIDMRLSIGVIICKTINIYYYNHATNNQECLEIPFEEDSELGEKFVELFTKENFTEENIIRFIKEQNESKILEEKIKSETTVALIKQLLIEHFSEKIDTGLVTKVITELNISVNEIQETISPVVISYSSPVKAPQIDSGKRTVTLNGTTLPIYRSEKQPVQDFVQETLTTLFKNNILTNEEIVLLQDKKYSKENFGIQYSLLVKNYEDTFEVTKNGKKYSRYWTWKKCNVNNKFYACSQWAKNSFDTYDKLIAQWLINLENARNSNV